MYIYIYTYMYVCISLSLYIYIYIIAPYKREYNTRIYYIYILYVIHTKVICIIKCPAGAMRIIIRILQICK